MNNSAKIRASKIINLSFWVILINFCLEYFILLFESRNFIIILQTSLNLLFLFHALNQTVNLRTTPFTKIIVFISIYTLVLCFFSSAIIDSFNLTLKFVIPLYFLIIGYQFIESFKKLELILRRFNIVLIIFIISSIYYNTFNIGESFYQNGFKTGYMSVNAYYLVCFVWIALLLLIKRKNWVNTIILIITCLIIFTILKRTVIILVLMALAVYFFRNLNIKRFFSLTIITGLGILLFQQYFSEYFETSVESRSSRFEEDYTVEEEGRFQENVLPFLYIQDDYLMYVVGTGEVFHDRPYHLKYLNVDRQLHNSFIRLFWSGGLILLVLFSILVYKQFKFLFKLRKRIKGDKYTSSMVYFTIAFVFFRFISEFSSGITYVSYNMFSYLVIGAVIGVTRRRIIKSQAEYNASRIYSKKANPSGVS